MKRNVKLIIIVIMILTILTPLCMPTISEAYELTSQIRTATTTMSIKLKRDEINNNKINVTATDTTYNITDLKYVHKYIDVDNIDYFEGNNNDVKTFNITPSKNIQTSFELEGYGSYTVYGKNANGDRYLSRITLKDPEDMPDLTLIKDEQNPLYLTIQATSKNNIISKIKIAKKDNINDEIDFSKEGTEIEFVPSNNVNIKYTKLTEEGLYQVYVEDNKANKVSREIYISKEGTPINVEITEGNDVRKVNIKATDSLCKIIKIKVAKKSEITDFEDFNTKGEEIKFTPSQEVNTTYTAPEDNTYVFYIENEAGYKKMTEKRITAKENTMNITIEQDKQEPKKLTIIGTDEISNITTMKILIGKNVTIKDIKEKGENISITPGKKVTATYNITENCTINVYIQDEQGYGYMISKMIIGIDGPTINVPPTITIKQNTDNLKQVDVTVSDADSYISKVKWAEGSKNVDYFLNNGTQIGQGSLGKLITTKFEIEHIGTYTVYAEDDSGNKIVEEIEITNINKPAEDITSPELTITQKNINDKNVAVSILAKDMSNEISVIKIAKGNKDINYFENEGQNLELQKDKNTAKASLNISENGEYTVYTKDSVGNKAIKTFNITTIIIPEPEPEDKNPPIIKISKKVSDDYKKVIITIEVRDEESQIKTVKIVNGEKETEYFKNDGTELNIQKEDKIAFAMVEITKNGTYTIYGEDEKGNGIVKVINVLDIKDEVKPPVDPDGNNTNIEDNKNNGINTNSSNSNNSGSKVNTSNNKQNQQIQSKLPYAGSKNLIAIGIVIMIIVSIFSFIKYRKMRKL